MEQTRYDPEADPNPEVLDLTIEVARLKAMFRRWGKHQHICQTRDVDGCECGFKQAVIGTLWDFVGDSEDINKATESHWDDGD